VGDGRGEGSGTICVIEFFSVYGGCTGEVRYELRSEIIDKIRIDGTIEGG
jgi:hypothetical protein